MEYRGTIEGLKNIVRKAGYEIIEPKFTQHMSPNLLHQIEISEGGVIIWNDSTGEIALLGRKILWQRLKKELTQHMEKNQKLLPISQNPFLQKFVSCTVMILQP
ncbi:hypothetical protein [Bartonella birtlesii]|uniref:hypothetical protein n=1 Tax=Bartonella birtlesii TaxID=111504 RepID=UPI0003060CD6